MLARIEYGDNYVEIKKFMHSIEDKNNGNPYNTSFELIVKSNGFTGYAPYECDIDKFRFFVNQMEDLYNFKISEVSLRDICYDSKVKFLLDKCGHLEVSGEIFAEAKEQSLKFLFFADQTALAMFVAELKKLISV